MAPRKKPAAQEVEVGAVATPTKPSSKKPTAQEIAPPRFSLMRIMHSVLNEVEKKAGLLTVGFGRHAKRLSTGLISLDMYLDGGLIPGGWYTIAGPEQSAKSTLTMTLVAATIKQKFNGVGAVFDYEGSSDEEYITNMLLNFGLEIDREKIFGVQDPETGEYLVEGFFRYYAPERGEEFFAYMSMMRRRLPDKIINENGEAYYVFENTKANQSMLKGQYDPSYFKRTNKFRVKAEDTSMQLCVVVDSYPAMMPEQLDDDDPSAAMALQARMFSDGIKRFRGGMRRKMMTIFGVNQLRERPAVQHGDPVYEPCFIGSTPVHLADGTVDTIRNIVLKKRDVEVLSFNKETGEVTAKRIIDWKDNGNKLTSDLVVVRYNAFDHNGCPKVAEFTCTKDHKIWSPSGWVKAGDLNADSEICLNLPRDTYSSDQSQIIYGALLGDGSFSCAKGSLGWNVMFDHVRYQVPYMMWKAQALDFGNVFDIPNDSNVQRYKPSGEHSQFTTFKHFNPTMAKYARVLKSNHTRYGKKQVAAVTSILDKLDARGLAVWYMDDGHFANDRKNGMWVITISCDRFPDALKEKAIDVIESITGVRSKVHDSHGKIFISGKDDCLRFQEAIANYVHPSMSYKLYECELAGGYEWEMREPKVTNGLHKTKVVSVSAPDGIKSKYTRVYDLTIEDNHTYFVGGSPRNCDLAESRVRRSVRADGVAVSNCGNALKFYCVDPMTSVEVKKSDGIVMMTALEYLNTHDSENPWPIRCPAYEGFIEPKAAFKSDGGKYASRGAWKMRTVDGQELCGSAGHSVLIASPVKMEYPHMEALHDTDIPAYETPEEHDYGHVTVPNVCWTRMHRVAEGSYAFVDANLLSDRQSNEQWAKFLRANVPELAAMFEHLCPDYNVPFERRITDFEELMYAVYARTNLSELYDMVMMQFAYVEELATVYLQLSTVNNLVPSLVESCESQDTAPEFYVDFSTEGSWISNGIVSHNSDVRIRVMPRAIPAGFAGERGVVEEPSAEFVGENRVDRYKFISGRTIKNKLGGIPNQEYWMRLWESDGTGRARGFDPMYDVWWSLKQMGMITGQRNKMKFLAPCPLAKSTRALSWLDLKTLVVGSKKQISELCSDIGIKPLSIRSWCFSYIRSEEGKQRVRDSIIRKSTAVEETE